VKLHSDKTQAYLEAALLKLQTQNPGRVFVLDSGAVWLREGGRDLGIYSAVITDERILCCMDAAGRSPLHRATPAEVAA
jgi:hypothetical protein